MTDYGKAQVDLLKQLNKNYKTAKKLLKEMNFALVKNPPNKHAVITNVNDKAEKEGNNGK